MSASSRRGPVPEDLFAVTGHCCSVRLTRLSELEDGIDFRPATAARADFEKLQLPLPSLAARTETPEMRATSAHDSGDGET